MSEYVCESCRNIPCRLESVSTCLPNKCPFDVGEPNWIMKEPCAHDWIDASNEKVSGTDLCIKCGAIRSSARRKDELIDIVIEFNKSGYSKYCSGVNHCLMRFIEFYNRRKENK